MSQPVTSDPEPHLIDTRLGPIAIAEEGDPEAEAILCVHGVPGSTRDFRYLGPHLAQRLRVIRIDMPGYGHSPAGDVDRVERWSQLPSAVADALGLGRFLLLAHSFGSGPVLLAANTHRDRIDGVALLAGNGPRRHRGMGLPPQVMGVMSLLLEVPLVRDRTYRAGRAVYERLKLPPPADRHELKRHLLLIASQRFERIGRWASALQQPAVVAYCRDDKLIEVEIARELAARIRDARVLEFESGGHQVQKNRAREAARAVIERFVEAPEGFPPAQLGYTELP